MAPKATLSLLAVIAVCAGSAAGQQTAADTAARHQAMTRLAFLEGDWAGKAWASQGPGSRLEMWQTERVRFKIGGQVLLVEGLGRRLVDGQPADTVFHALGTIDWLPERGYLMRSFTLAGQQGEFPLTVSESGFVWGFDVRGGRVRYTMQVTPSGDWNEKGEFTRDGEQWFPIFEMTLGKVRSER